MNVNRPEAGGYIGSSITTLLAAVQTNEIFQLVEIILACISFVITISYTIYKWYKNAKSDGKITSDEIEDLVDDVKNTIDKQKEDK